MFLFLLLLRKQKSLLLKIHYEYNHEMKKNITTKNIIILITCHILIQSKSDIKYNCNFNPFKNYIFL